jgi:hypothetical protein
VACRGSHAISSRTATFTSRPRGAGGAQIFVVDLDRVDFLDLLEATTNRFGWRRHAHCLPGTHYHLVIEPTREALSAGMQRLNGVYVLRFNRRHARKEATCSDARDWPWASA